MRWGYDRLVRRPPSDEELERQQMRMAASITLMFTQPEFLFRFELGDDHGSGRLQLTAFELAQAITITLTRRSPLEVFGAASSEMAAPKAFEERRLLLDYMREDISRARGRLAGEERWKFDRYLYAVETFERQHTMLTARRDQLVRCAPLKPGAVGAEEDVSDHIPKQVRLACAAMICGLTDLVVLSFGSGPFNLTTFGNWGFGGRHSMGHGGGATETWPGGPAGLVACHNEIAKVIADEMIRPLEAMPEADGTMFDQTTIVFLNDNGSEHHSKYDNYPVTVVGDLGGSLRTGGRLIEYPNRKQSGTRGLGEFWNTVCHALDVPKDDFGRGGRARSMGPLDELLPT